MIHFIHKIYYWRDVVTWSILETLIRYYPRAMRILDVLRSVYTDRTRQTGTF